MRNPDIRRGAAQDAARISGFVCGLAKEFIVGEFSAGARTRFLDDHTEAKVEERLRGDFRFYVVEDGGRIAGVAAIRSNSHLFYLFVGTEYQHMGLARRLLARVTEDSLPLGNPGKFTVNASNYAVPAYEKLGFRRTGAMKNADGVLYNPMELTL